MKPMGRRTLLAAAAAALAALLLCTGCYSSFDSEEEEDMSNMRSLGEAVTVDYSFNFLNLYRRGPYELQVTPMGLVRLHCNGDTYDCVEVKYKVLSTDDGEPADFANCTVVVGLVNDSAWRECEYDTWFVDTDGTKADVQAGEVPLGVETTFYIPLRRGFESLDYVAVSDMSGYYERSGITYWYPIDPSDYEEIGG